MGKHERWDEEWREDGRTHGWELPRPRWPLRLEASGTCERPWPPCSSYDDKDSSACRLIISPPVMTTGLFTRLGLVLTTYVASSHLIFRSRSSNTFSMEPP